MWLSRRALQALETQPGPQMNLWSSPAYLAIGGSSPALSILLTKSEMVRNRLKIRLPLWTRPYDSGSPAWT